MTSISTVLKVLVISLVILQISGRRGKAKRKHPRRQISPIRAVQCPTECHRFLDEYNRQLVREVKPGQFLVETRVATHCDTDCLDNCLQTQDPENTQMISYTCAPLSSVCDYRENKECAKHVFKSDGEPLPWPYDEDKAEEEQVKPQLSDYSNDQCPVCMDSDLSDKMVGCMKNRYKTESCVGGDSCWVYDLSGSLTVNLLNGDHIVLEKVIKCQRNDLAGQGCSNEKCTGKFRRVQEEIDRSNTVLEFTSTPQQRIVTREIETTKRATEPATSAKREVEEDLATESQKNDIEKASTEPDEQIVTVKPEPSTEKPATESHDEIMTEDPTTESDHEIVKKPSTQSDHEIVKKPSTQSDQEPVNKFTTETSQNISEKPATESKDKASEKPTPDSENFPTNKYTTESDMYTTKSERETDKDATEDVTVNLGTTTSQHELESDNLMMNPGENENLAVDDRETDVVCSEDVQNCPDDLMCYGRKMNDGEIEYVCAISVPDCTGSDGCIGLCTPPFIPCVTALTSPVFSTEPDKTTESEIEKTTGAPKDNSTVGEDQIKTNNVESSSTKNSTNSNESNETGQDNKETDTSNDDGEILGPITEEVSNTKGSNGKSSRISCSNICLWLIVFFMLFQRQV